MLLRHGFSVPIHCCPYLRSSIRNSRPRLRFTNTRHCSLLLSASNSNSISTADLEASQPLDNLNEGEEELQEELQVKELEDLPEQWRRSKVAWLCRELPAHVHSTFTRILNAQRKWITQDDTSYILLHCLRIRENESAFRVHRWMSKQHWYKFNFLLTTKLADCLGKDRRVAKCRELFDEIISRGQVPHESTFHVLVVAYLSAPVEGGLEEACGIYDKMIRLGGYRPKLSLHNSLFRAIVSRPGVSARLLLDQAEFIFRNLVSCRMEIQKDIYAGLIWLHSYQDVVDRRRIEELRTGMREAGFEESRDVLVSILRACSKEGDVEEGERTWSKILSLGSTVPSQAFVYHMEIYSKKGQPMRALDLFRSMDSHGVSPNVVIYQKIIEVMTKADEIEIVESLMTQLVESRLKPLSPCYLALMDMYTRLEMHQKVEMTFSKCLSMCSPNLNIYTMYLNSLVKSNRMEKAEEIFNEMQANEAIGTSSLSCNIILGGFLASGDDAKAEKLSEMMLQRNYEIEPAHIRKLRYNLGLKKKMVQKPTSLKLDIEQREILIGLLLGGLVMESDDQRKIHSMRFEFKENSGIHRVLASHIYERFHEWLFPCEVHDSGNFDGMQWSFSTIRHLHFGFFADQFWPKGRLAIPRLIHRWLSERVLAYWYMYGGFRTSSGHILLKLKVGQYQDVERVVKWFIAKSLSCKVKRKGRVFWIGLLGHDAVLFWEMIEPYVLETTKEHLNPGSRVQGNGTDLVFSSSDSDSGHDSNEEQSAADMTEATGPDE